MNSITIHCSDCKPGILAGESIIFNKDKVRIFSWPFGIIPSLQNSSSNRYLNELMDYIKNNKRLNINLISHTPCEYTKYSQFFNLEGLEIENQSIKKSLISNYKNLMQHMIKSNLDLKGYSFNLYLFDEKIYSLNRVNISDIESELIDFNLKFNNNKLIESNI